MRVRTTAIPGLLVLDLVVHEDGRGWFKENWQRAAMVAAGLPDFGPVQHNLAFNARAGTTRGFHGEPWDKLVSVAHGRVLGAWVDLREGHEPRHLSLELGIGHAVFVPRGVANAYQALVDETVYSYLVNDHWSPERTSESAYVNLADPQLAIPWPTPLADADVSAADRAHPPLARARRLPARRTIVVGAGGQLGRALSRAMPDAMALRRDQLDLTDPASLDRVDLSRAGAIINAAADTDVDGAETPEGRRRAWATNVHGVAALCRAASRRGLTLVHVSSDYVFDGTVAEHPEDEAFSPLGVYGQTKAAGDALVGQLRRHYIVRTSWLVGEGRNFVATMVDLATRGACPDVVDDQFGRLAFAEDLAAATAHLVRSEAPCGTYNVTNSGPVQSWADVASDVFELCGRSRDDVRRVSTEAYASQRPDRPTAPRPRHSALALDRIRAAGYAPPPASERLATHVEELLRRGRG